MEDHMSVSLYENNWSLLSIDGDLLGSGPSSPVSEEWHQQDELKKMGPGQSHNGAAPDLVDQLLGIQEQIGQDIDASWLDTRYNLSSLLSGEPVSISESMAIASGEADPQQITESAQELMASFEKAGEVEEGIINLDNGQHGSLSLLELLTGSETTKVEPNSLSELETVEDPDLHIITSNMDFSPSQDSITSLSAEDVESVFSSCPSSPRESGEETDPTWSPGGSDLHRNKMKASLQQDASPQKSKGRVPEVERKNRKKEQNRTAATRYRNKKRQEQDTANDEYLQLQERNRELKDKVANISQEIQYLKSLMSEVYKVKKAKKM